MSLDTIFHNFVRHAEAESLPIESIAIADEDNILFEHHFTPDLVRNIYSHTKSYTSTAAGLAVSEGKLSLEDRLADFFPEYIPDEPDPRLLRITLRCLLTMSSGFCEPYLMQADRRAGMGFPDYLGFMMSRPVKAEPGSGFVYSTADSILAGRMVEKAVGRNLAAYLYEKLFSKLGQGWPIWENDPQGHPIGGASMFMRLTDMMKLGQLYLAGGKWKGEQIVDPSWIREAVRKQIETPGEPDIWLRGYGYQWWISPYPGSYRADGAFGQVTTVLPRAGLVVAVQCPETGNFDIVKKALHEEIFLEISGCT